MFHVLLLVTIAIVYVYVFVLEFLILNWHNNWHHVESLDCRLNPCVNGQCNSGPTGYTCSCDQGYAGSTCDTGKISNTYT